MPQEVSLIARGELRQTSKWRICKRIPLPQLEECYGEAIHCNFETQS
jgi:hypothetical protein